MLAFLQKKVQNVTFPYGNNYSKSRKTNGKQMKKARSC